MNLFAIWAMIARFAALLDLAVAEEMAPQCWCCVLFGHKHFSPADSFLWRKIVVAVSEG